jgi:hypothetical protein
MLSKIRKSQLKSLLPYLLLAILCLTISIPNFDNIVSIFPSPVSKQNIQATDVRIKGLENTQTLTSKKLEEQSRSATPLLNPWVNIAVVIQKIPSSIYNPSYPSGDPFIYDFCCPNVPNEIINDNHVIAVNYKFYVGHPISIDLVQLSIDGKNIQSPPLLFKQATPEMIAWPTPLWLYFKCEGTINSGQYNDVTLIVTSDNKTYESNRFSITIP